MVPKAQCGLPPFYQKKKTFSVGVLLESSVDTFFFLSFVKKKSSGTHPRMFTLVKKKQQFAKPYIF